MPLMDWKVMDQLLSVPKEVRPESSATKRLQVPLIGAPNKSFQLPSGCQFPVNGDVPVVIFWTASGVKQVWV